MTLLSLMMLKPSLVLNKVCSVPATDSDREREGLQREANILLAAETQGEMLRVEHVWVRSLFLGP